MATRGSVITLEREHGLSEYPLYPTLPSLFSLLPGALHSLRLDSRHSRVSASFENVLSADSIDLASCAAALGVCNYPREY